MKFNYMKPPKFIKYLPKFPIQTRGISKISAALKPEEINQDSL